MKDLILCCIVATLLWEVDSARLRKYKSQKVAALDDGPPNLPPSWLKQILDHNSNDTPTYWDQKYYVRKDIWSRSAKAPVFLMIGGEDEISSDIMYGDAWVTWAYKYGAILFQLEHRFYGDSHPTDDASTDNLKYLTVQQALGDIKYFIQQMNNKYLFTSYNKWFVFGGSYPGNLAAWARLKMPDLIYGAVSSSGPLQAKADFSEYHEVIRSSLETVPGCSKNFATAVKSIQTMLKDPTKMAIIMKKLNTCPGFNPTNPKDVSLLSQDLISKVDSAVQYNGVSTDPSDTITFVCSFLNNASTPDPVDRLAALLKNTSTQCQSAFYIGDVRYFSKSDWTDPAVSRNSRQWYYQQCYELGFFQTSSTPSELLSNMLPLSFFTQKCTDVFGPNFNANQLNAGVDNTNKVYGGWNIQVDRVVFVQGSIDPWHPLGMVKTVNSESPLIYINGTSHCQDQTTPQKSDSQPLKDARAQIGSYLGKWIAAP